MKDESSLFILGHSGPSFKTFWGTTTFEGGGGLTIYDESIK